MKKKYKVLEDLDRIAQMLPTPFYWLDTNNAVLGGNDLALHAMGGVSKEEIVGKTPYEYYPKEIADNIVNHNKKVIEAGKILSQEETIKDITTGKTRYFTALKAPLYDEKGNIIGTIGTSIEITAEKEAEQLREQIARHEAVAEEQGKFQGFVEQLLHVINGYQISALNHKLGKSQPNMNTNITSDIVLTTREKEVLYYLNLNMTPKEIASILSIIGGKDIKPKSVQAVIDKQLYPKFDVYSVSQLIEKANLLKLTPFLL